MQQQAISTEAFIPAMTLLNSTGDVTITWDEKDQDSILALVEAKMKQGYSFFILKPRPFGLPGHSKKSVDNIESVKKANHVVVPDDLVQDIVRKSLGDTDVENAVQAGQAKLVSSAAPQGSNRESVKRATSAKEVVKHQTMAVRPIVGG